MAIQVEKDENSVKCVAIGDAAVGKTALLITYTTNKFPHDYVPTVFDNFETELEVNGELFKFQLWDTAGAEHYDMLRPLSYSETDVFIVVYSVINRDSFNNVDTKWVTDITDKGDEGVPYILIGNKVDLRDSYKEAKPVSTVELEKMQAKTGAARSFEASALTQEGLKEAFDGVVTLAFGRLQEKRRDNENTKENQLAPAKAQRRGCCTLI